MLAEYIGLAERVEDSYTVFFPDFLGLDLRAAHWRKQEKTHERV